MPLSTTTRRASITLLLTSVAALFGLLLLLRWRIGRRSGMVLVGSYGVYVGSVVLGLF